MTYLLDTHAFLWLLSGDRRLSPLAKRLFLASSTELVLSIVSAWEVSIKYSLGKLRLPDMPRRWLRRHLSAQSIELLPVSFDQVTLVAELPFHHRDPFARLIASQALDESLELISADRVFDAYGVKRIW
jgi:PIN domain nuclease of toxin-antitoxin system